MNTKTIKEKFFNQGLSLKREKIKKAKHSKPKLKKTSKDVKRICSCGKEIILKGDEPVICDCGIKHIK